MSNTLGNYFQKHLLPNRLERRRRNKKRGRAAGTTLERDEVCEGTVHHRNTAARERQTPKAVEADHERSGAVAQPRFRKATTACVTRTRAKYLAWHPESPRKREREIARGNQEPIGTCACGKNGRSGAIKRQISRDTTEPKNRRRTSSARATEGARRRGASGNIMEWQLGSRRVRGESREW